MHSISIVLVFALIAIASSAPAEDKPHYDLDKAPEYFEKFIKDYNRAYKDAADKEVHYQAFVKSLVEINKYNAESKTATYDVNKFADYTVEELKNLFGLITPKPT